MIPFSDCMKPHKQSHLHVHTSTGKARIPLWNAGSSLPDATRSNAACIVSSTLDTRFAATRWDTGHSQYPAC
jgi:hypothetical protein